MSEGKLQRLLSPSKYPGEGMRPMPDFVMEFDADSGDVTIFARWCDPWIVISRHLGESLDDFVDRFHDEMVAKHHLEPSQ